MKLRLTIHLGNDAMQTMSDVRRALIHTVNDMQRLGVEEPVAGDDGLDGNIRDANGNNVGRWRFMHARKRKNARGKGRSHD